MAYLSWRFVEAPFRDRARFSRRSIFAMAGVATVIAFCCGAAIIFAKGLPQRFPPRARLYLALLPTAVEVDPVLQPVTGRHSAGTALRHRRGRFVPQPAYALWGDSHAFRLAMPLDKMAAPKHKTGVLISIGGCPPLPGGSLARLQDGCDSRLRRRGLHRGPPDDQDGYPVGDLGVLHRGRRVRRQKVTARSSPTASTKASVEENRRVFARAIVSLVQRLRARAATSWWLVLFPSSTRRRPRRWRGGSFTEDRRPALPTATSWRASRPCCPCFRCSLSRRCHRALPQPLPVRCAEVRHRAGRRGAVHRRQSPLGAGLDALRPLLEDVSRGSPTRGAMSALGEGAERRADCVP